MKAILRRGTSLDVPALVVLAVSVIVAASLSAAPVKSDIADAAMGIAYSSNLDDGEFSQRLNSRSSFKANLEGSFARCGPRG